MNSVFATSTQNSKWMFSSDQINSLISEKYKKGFKLFQSLSTEHLDTKNVIKPGQESLIIRFFCNRIIKICNQFKFPTNLKTHVVTYFKRFFLKKLILDFDADFVFYACFYLGFKVCEIEVGLMRIKDIFSSLKDDVSDTFNKTERLLNYEFYLIEVLSYDLHVYCPYRAMKGIIYSLFITSYSFLNESSDFEKFEDLIFKDGSCIIDQSFLNDLSFNYSYSKIALFSTIYYSKHVLVQKINHDLVNNSSFIVNLSELKHKLDSHLEQIIESLKNQYSNILNEYDHFEVEINKLKESNNEVEVKRFITKTNKFISDNNQYNNKLNEKRNEYIAKLKEFSNNFEVLIKGNVNEENLFIHHKRKNMD